MAGPVKASAFAPEPTDPVVLELLRQASTVEHPPFDPDWAPPHNTKDRVVETLTRVKEHNDIVRSHILGSKLPSSAYDVDRLPPDIAREHCNHRNKRLASMLSQPRGPSGAPTYLRRDQPTPEPIFPSNTSLIRKPVPDVIRECWIRLKATDMYERIVQKGFEEWQERVLAEVQGQPYPHHHSMKSTTFQDSRRASIDAGALRQQHAHASERPAVSRTQTWDNATQGSAYADYNAAGANAPDSSRRPSREDTSTRSAIPRGGTYDPSRDPRRRR